MKKYMSYLRMYFIAGLQYRGAALGGLATQYAWGFLFLLQYRAFYASDPGAIPMPYPQLVSYIWLNQAFLMLFNTFRYDREIVESITKGQIAYELVRPLSLYGMWLSRDLGSRIAAALLRSVPVLILAALLPEPFGMHLPGSFGGFLLFLLSTVLGTLNCAAFTLLQYLVIFRTLSPGGIRSIAIALTELFSGALIPLPFFPPAIRNVLALLPFAAMQNSPLRIYSDNLSGPAALTAIGVQVFWCAVMLSIGSLGLQRQLRRVVVQGG